MKNTKHDIFDIELDEEEKEIRDTIDKAIDKRQLKSVENLPEELAFTREAATNYFKKDVCVTLRLSSGDLARLKQKAAYKGLPYQTFIASVLHDYAAGNFRNLHHTI